MAALRSGRVVLRIRQRVGRISNSCQMSYKQRYKIRSSCLPMKNVLFLSLWLLLSSQASFSEEHRQAQSSGISLQGTGSLTIIYEDGANSGFSDDEKQLI